MSKVRMHLELNRELDDELEALAKDEGTTKSEIMRRSFSIMLAFKEQAKRGRKHLGFVADMTKLDAEMLGVLSSVGRTARDAGNH